MSEERISKEEYYLNIAEAVGARGTCIRRNYGAIIVKADEIISTGYTGTPRGEVNCCDCGECERERLGIKSGERYELCKSVHAEMNCIISASRADMLGATLYLVGKDKKTGELVDAAPCMLCERLIKNAGIAKIIARQSDGSAKVTNIAGKSVLNALESVWNNNKNI
jgi:dCMP deaminase